jgi:hypothetical protein
MLTIRKKRGHEIYEVKHGKRVLSSHPTRKHALEAGKLTAKEIEDFSKASYKSKKEADNLHGYKLDRSLSTKRNKVFVNPEGKVVVANAGTSTFTDWANNLAIPFGLHHHTARYKEAEDIQKKAISKYGKQNVSNVAHSQSGNIVENLAKRGLTGEETIAINPAIIGKHHKNVQVIKSGRDIVSALTKTRKHDIVKQGKTFNILKEHSPEIVGRGKRVRIMC